MYPQRDPNRGPIKLDHDLTPRDLTRYNPNLDERNNPNTYRFQGYPEKQFERAKDRGGLQSRASLEVDNPASRIQKEFHGTRHYFDKNKPTVNGEPVGLQYGSDTASIADPSQPRRVGNPFMSKTSAELLKFRDHQREVEDDIQQYKREKLSHMLAQDKEKKENMAMLQTYDPFGKPGGGAPGGSNKKQKFMEADLEKLNRTPRQNRDYTEEYGDFHSGFGRPGAGAPLKTESGNIKTEMKSDPYIRFQDTQKGRQVFETEVRYKQGKNEQQKYSKDLDAQIQEKQLQEKENRISNLKKELEMLKHDPYGKPGAGAPNKSLSGTRCITKRYNTLLSETHNRRKQDNRGHETEPNRTRSDFQAYDPWGQGYGAPQRDSHGDVVRHRAIDKNREVPTQLDRPKDRENGVGLDISPRRGGGGAPVITQSGHVRTRMPQTMAKDERGDTTMREEMPGRPAPRELVRDDPEHQVYDPWGKGYGSKEARATKPAVKTDIYGRVEDANSAKRRKEAKQLYLEELQREMEEQKETRQQQDQLLKAGEGELASLMTQGMVGRPRRNEYGMLANQHLGFSDVTMEKTNTRRQITDASKDYHTELEREAKARRQLHELEKLKTQQEARFHQNTMNKFWGKPGGGAPANDTPRKKPIDRLLNPPTETSESYNKRVEGPEPQNKVRSTVLSRHTNQYEYPTAHKRMAKQDYKLLTPFATANGEVF